MELSAPLWRELATSILSPCDSLDPGLRRGTGWHFMTSIESSRSESVTSILSALPQVGRHSMTLHAASATLRAGGAAFGIS